MIRACMTQKELADKFNGQKVPNTGKYQYRGEDAGKALKALGWKDTYPMFDSAVAYRYDFSSTHNGILMITTPRNLSLPLRCSNGFVVMGRLLGLETDIVIEPALYTGEYEDETNEIRKRDLGNCL